MHWLDFVLIVTLLVGAVLGARSGLIWQVARLAIFAVAIYACINWHGPAADWLQNSLTGMTPFVTQLLAYVITFLLVCLAGFLVTYFIERAVRAAHLKPIDRVLGAVVGMLKVGLLAGGILMGVLVYVPKSEQAISGSVLAPPLLQGMQVVIVAVPQKFKDDVSEALEKVKQEGAAKLKESAAP